LGDSERNKLPRVAPHRFSQSSFDKSTVPLLALSGYCTLIFTVVVLEIPAEVAVTVTLPGPVCE
jgi:hypothetical protein